MVCRVNGQQCAAIVVATGQKYANQRFVTSSGIGCSGFTQGGKVQGPRPSHADQAQLCGAPQKFTAL
jgi:hypothetical protein